MKLALVAGVLFLAGCSAASGPSSPGPSALPTAGAGTPRATPTLVPSTTAPGTAAPGPTTSPGPSGLGITFEQVATLEGTELYAAAAFGGGFVVGGCRLRPESEWKDHDPCAEARLLYSLDGRRWTDGELSGAAGRRILAFADTPLGLLAFGSNTASEPPLARSIWRSTDGSRWEPYSIPAPEAIVFSAAFVLNGRTVLIGSDSSYDFAVETEAWATTDGRSWARGSTPMVAKVAASPGIVALGTDCVDVCPEDVPLRVFRSADAVAWTEGAADPSLASGQISVLGAWVGKAVAGGAVEAGAVTTAAVWFDEPGGWRITSLPDGRGYAVDALIGGGDRLIAVGRSDDDERGRAWWTADGRRWEPAILGGVETHALAAWAGVDPIVVIAGFKTIWRTRG